MSIRASRQELIDYRKTNNACATQGTPYSGK